MCFSKVNENNQSNQVFPNDFNWKKGIGEAVLGISIAVAVGGALSLIATTGVLPNALVFVGDPLAISMVVGGTFVAITTGIVIKKLCETPAYVFSNDLETAIFEIESESSSSLSLDEEAVDCIETEEEMRAAFKENILNLYKTKCLSDDPAMPTLTEEERLLVEAAYNFSWDRKEPVHGFKFCGSGGEFRCFSLEQIPGWIFKRPSYRNFDDKHLLNCVKRMKEERSFVQKNHLYFLHVPKSQSVNVTDHAFNQELSLIMEEKLVVIGDSVGGNMAAAVTLLAQERKGPKIDYQILFYPVTDANFNTSTYQEFATGHWLTRKAMEWFWDNYLPDKAKRKEPTASPLQASLS